jgi:3-oxoacyl-[acyl-carrier-protein] synthase II
MVTPLGNNLGETWGGLCAGRSGVGYISHFDACTLPTRIAGEVRDFQLADYVPDADRLQFAGNNAQFAMAAAAMAVKDSGLELDRTDRTRLGVYLGAGEGQQDFLTFMRVVRHAYRDGRVDTAVFNELAMQEFHPVRELEQEPNMPSAHVAELFDARGPNANCLTACAASSQAIGEALEIVRRGDADCMISGGAHSMIHPLGVTGFNLLTALSTRNDNPSGASRPFDRDRDGFILGEGAGMVVLEELEHAQRRGARIYGEVIGYGSSADAFRITDPHEAGRGAIACLRDALRDADLAPAQIQYINAHGTSTKEGDYVETLAIKTVFGADAAQIPVSSIKSMTGHLIAAAGSVELITCLLVIRDGVIPPTINYENPDPDCDLDYVPNQAREKDVDVALSNSFGFGGQNICLIARRFTG